MRASQKLRRGYKYRPYCPLFQIPNLRFQLPSSLSSRCIQPQPNSLSLSIVQTHHKRSKMHFSPILLLYSLLSLIPTIASAPTGDLSPRTCPSTIIKDGSFESGTVPQTSGTTWTVVNTRGFYSSYSVTNPGSPSGGKNAFTVSHLPGPYDGTGIRELRQTLSTCVGKNYSITADFKFEAAANNYCSLAVVYPFKTGVGSVTTSSATPGLTPGVWSTTGGFFQAVSSSSLLNFVFRCDNQERNKISLDNVKVNLFNGNAY